jgi:hypothetical protein
VSSIESWSLAWRLIDGCEVSVVGSFEEAFPGFGLVDFVDIKEFVVPETLWEGDVIW